MKKNPILWLAFFLLISVLPTPAVDLTVSPSGVVPAGTVLHFSAQLIYGEAPCDEQGNTAAITYFVACWNGGSWKTEHITPVKNTGLQWYNFNAAYTVTAADVNNPDFCFVLIENSQCLPFDRPYDNLKKCPPTKFVIPHFHLEKYIECWRVPGCPGCLKLDLGQLIRTLGDPLERMQVVLLRNGVQLAMLGEVGRGLRLPAHFQITLPGDAGITRQRQVANYQLRVLGKNGRVLASEDVTLKIK